jgi:hypothetical protein
MKAWTNLRHGAQWILRVGRVAAFALCISGCSGNDDEVGDDGGGADCGSLCEEGQNCPDADPAVDCAQSCADVERLTEAAGCNGEYQTLLDCAADVNDVCMSTDECYSETRLYADCVVPFCTDNPDQC